MTLAANVGVMFLASGARVKCMFLNGVNVLEDVFETRPTAGKHKGGVSVLTNVGSRVGTH